MIDRENMFITVLELLSGKARGLAKLFFSQGNQLVHRDVAVLVHVDIFLPASTPRRAGLDPCT